MIFEVMVGSHSHERSIEYAFVARNFSATKSGMRILDVRSESSELTRIISIIGWKQGCEVYYIDYSIFEQQHLHARQMGFRDNLFERILCMFEHVKVQPLDQTSDKIDRSSVVKAISRYSGYLEKEGESY